MIDKLLKKLTKIGLKYSGIYRTKSGDMYNYSLDVWGHRPPTSSERGDKVYNQRRFMAGSLDELAEQLKTEFKYAI